MTGGKQSKVRIVLRNPLNFKDQIDYTISVHDHELGRDWINALKGLIQSGNLLEKNYCFMGFPKTQRNLDYLCKELQTHVNTINNFFDDYRIDEIYTPETVENQEPLPEVEQAVMEVAGAARKFPAPNHDTLNKLHNHFERLQGTVWNLSDYYRRADYETKYAIRQLNNICHEIENLILGRRKEATAPFWVRPSQITTFINSPRLDLKDTHRELFLQNGYDRVLGGVYMHWTQIGKTLFEVFRDEDAPKLTIGNDPTDIRVGAGTTCEAINSLRFYSGEFDIEWANDVVHPGVHYWHSQEQEAFQSWLKDNGLDPLNPKLSLGYLPIGQVNLKESFGTDYYQDIWDILSNHLDIYKIEVDGIDRTYEYCWSDSNYKQMQIDMMKPGYDYSSRG